MDRAPLLRLAVLAWLPLLGACDAVRQVDASLRRIEVLDRLFQPQRPPEAPVIAASVLVPATVVEGLPKDAGAEPVPTADLAPIAEPPPPAAASEPAAPPTPVASAPAPQAVPVAPALRRAALIRQNPWLTRFWGELTPDQRARAARRLPRADPATAWDRLGLAERVGLVFGERG